MDGGGACTKQDTVPIFRQVPRSSARRISVGLALVAAASLGLVSCKSSPPAHYAYTTSDGVLRCAAGQSAVGETADQTDSGSVISLAETKAMRSSGCDEDDNLHPAWSTFGVYVELHKRRSDGSTFRCASSGFVKLTTTDSSVNISAANRCGAGDYFTIGQHNYVPLYGPGAGYTNTFNTLTPLAYNS